MKFSLKHIITPFLILLFVFQLEMNFAKTYKKIDQSSYEEVIDGVDYEENVAKREQKERDPINFEPPELGDWSMLFQILKIVAIGALILGLAYFAFRIYEENYSDKRIMNLKEHEILENLEQHIHEVDLQDLLQKAVNKGDFKLAVRIYYLIIIKQMSDLSIIKWKKDKTNGAYLSEVFGQSYFSHFQQNTLIFERIWYGDVDINEGGYKSVVNKYQQFIEELPKINDETK